MGKSATGWELYEGLLRGRPRAYVDVDQLGMCYPAPEGDPDRHRLKARASGALIRRQLAAGAETVVVSGVLDRAALDTEVAVAAGVPVAFCRLRLATGDLLPRLEARYAPADVVLALSEAREWDLRQASPLVVDTTGLAVGEVARRVLDACANAEPVSAVPDRSDAPGIPGAAPGRAVLIHGPTAVGKSAVAFDLLRSLARDGVRTAYLDLEQLSFLADLPSGQAPDHAILSGFVAALWREYRAAGASELLLSGRVQDPGDVQHYRDALRGTPLTTCRLSADRSLIRARIQARVEGRGPDLAGDRLRGLAAERVTELVERAWLEQGQIAEAVDADLVLDTSGEDVATTARRLRSWLTRRGTTSHRPTR